MATNLEVVRVVLFEPELGSLVIKRPAHVSNSPGVWCLVGGKTDGEAAADAAQREIYEELGIHVQGLNFLCRRLKSYKGREWKMTYFWKNVIFDDMQKIKEKYNRLEISDVDFLKSESDVNKRNFAFGDNVVLQWFLTKRLMGYEIC
jgi:8-oxo-dGTP pyrophosphatase MutT (NUDIX family)